MFDYAPVKIINRIRLILSLLSPFILIYVISYIDGDTFIESARGLVVFGWNLLWFIPLIILFGFVLSYPLVYLVLIWDRRPSVVYELSYDSIIAASMMLFFALLIAFLTIWTTPDGYSFPEFLIYYIISLLTISITFFLLHFYLFWLYFKLNKVEYYSESSRDNKFSFCGRSLYFAFNYYSHSFRLEYQWQLNNGSGWVDLFDAGQFSGTNSSVLTIKNLNSNQNNSIVRCLIREKYLTKATKVFRLTILNDKDEVIEIIKNDGIDNYYDLLENAPLQIKTDREIVFEVIKKDALSLRYASEELKNDRELVLQAVKQEALALRYASEELQQDKSFVLEAIKINPKALDWVIDELRHDPDIQAAAN